MPARVRHRSEGLGLYHIADSKARDSSSNLQRTKNKVSKAVTQVPSTQALVPVDIMAEVLVPCISGIRKPIVPHPQC
jgi:hypothetical protein